MAQDIILPIPRGGGRPLVVRVQDGCWVPVSHRARTRGYATLWDAARGGPSYAHRIVYEALVGPVPDGLVLDHLCRRKDCVRPEHLEPVTQRENLMRGDTENARNAAKAACVNGHAYDAANTYVRPEGTRDCRVCRAQREADRRARQRGSCHPPG